MKIRIFNANLKNISITWKKLCQWLSIFSCSPFPNYRRWCLCFSFLINFLYFFLRPWLFFLRSFILWLGSIIFLRTFLILRLSIFILWNIISYGIFCIFLQIFFLLRLTDLSKYAALNLYFEIYKTNWVLLTNSLS